MKPNKPPKDALRAARKGSREAEIGMYDHPLPKHRVHRSKKQYDRKYEKTRLKMKAGFLFYSIKLSYLCQTPTTPILFLIRAPGTRHIQFYPAQRRTGRSFPRLELAGCQ
jgi:hypothetical protein